MCIVRFVRFYNFLFRQIRSEIYNFWRPKNYFAVFMVFVIVLSLMTTLGIMHIYNTKSFIYDFPILKKSFRGLIQKWERKQED